MAHKSTCCLLAWIAVRMLPVVLGIHYPDVVHGDAPCGSSSPISLDVIFTFVVTIPPDWQFCLTTFTVNSGSTLLAKFLIYDIDENYANEAGNCTVGSIQLYDVDKVGLLGANSAYCSSQMPKSLYDLGEEGAFVRYIGKKRYIWQTPLTVNILITAVIYKNTSCPDEYFDCENGYCLNEEMACNEYDNCGNNLDEGSICGAKHSFIGKVALASVLLIVAVSLICCVLCKMEVIK